MPTTDDTRARGAAAAGLVVPVVSGLARRLVRAGRLALRAADGRLILRNPADRGTATSEVPTLPLSAPKLGDLLVSQGRAWVRLPAGTNTHVLTADSSAAAGVKWAAASGGGSSDPAWRGAEYRQFRWNANLAAASLHGAGYGNMARAASGGNSIRIYAEGAFCEARTNTGSNNASGFRISGATSNPITERQWLPRFEARFKTYGDISNCAMYIGFWKNNGSVDNNLSKSEYRAGISYTAGTDSKWNLDESDGTNRTKTATTVTPAADTVYHVLIEWNDTNSRFDVEINGASVGSMSTHLPAASDPLGLWIYASTVNSGTQQGIRVGSASLQTR